jgi:hypothetical protein
MIALIALEPINEHGLKVPAGESFETTPILAAVLTRTRRARFQTLGDLKPRTRRTYRRRDLTAEPVAE